MRVQVAALEADAEAVEAYTRQRWAGRSLFVFAMRWYYLGLVWRCLTLCCQSATPQNACSTGPDPRPSNAPPGSRG